VAITKENLKIVARFEEIARTRYATSIASHPDVIRAQIELAVLEERLESLNELRPTITARLNSILNRAVDSNLPWPKPPKHQPVSVNFSELYGMITQNNPNLQALDYDVEAAKQREKLAKKKSYPNVGLGVSYIDTAHARASGMSESGKDPVMAMISLTLPIWSDNYKAAERQAKAQVRQKTYERAQVKNTLGSKAKELVYQVEDSEREIRLYEDVVIPKAEEMLAASETAYKAGAIDFLSLLDAQRMLLKYELLYERCVAESGQELAELEMLAGRELPRVGRNRVGG